MLSQINQTQKRKYCTFSPIWETQNINYATKEKETGRLTFCIREGAQVMEGGEGQAGEGYEIAKTRSVM